MEFKGKQKAMLRKLANDKDIMFQIGQSGITQQVIDNIITNLKKHEVGRVSILKNCPDSPQDIIEKIEENGIMVVYKIGRVLLLYKENKKLKNRIRL
ncbi:YhbY family RNA-binding protein [Mycoplasmatota bacterium]|nr:YhbY family RNA-binding protein [Mycoplasmatota bacterium]